MSFLKASDLTPKRKYKDLELEEFEGGTIRVQQLSAGASMEVGRMRGKENVASREINVFIVRNAIVDENRKPLFADEKSAGAFLDKISIQTILEISRTLSTFEKRPDDAEAEAEAAEGKSEGSPASSSSSA